MRPAQGPDAGVGRTIDPSARGIVSRPRLWGRLDDSSRVTVVSAPPGSGKTILLRSWTGRTDMAGRVAWVPVDRDEQDAQRLWLAVFDELRHTRAGSPLVRDLTAAPDLDGWALVERLLEDLATLAEPLWLVMDDVHELRSDEARRQLELLVLRAPPELRFVLATRHDLRLGFHRLRLEGELTEIRTEDLRFRVAEARALFEAAGMELAAPTLAMLYERSEGWAAGLRLAALSLAGHPDPERFAAEFSGSERTVADYLLAEVLESQPADARRLLLRTSVLDRVNGELADLLTDGSGGERVLQDLEEANAFVSSLDAARSWFRYHHLFADLLRLELRRSQPGEVPALHERAGSWFAEHGFPVEAIRHAQAAEDWERAGRLLAEHWPGLHLDGQAGTVHALLGRFPPGAPAADPGLAAVVAADEIGQGSLAAAEQYLRLAERGSTADAASGPDRVLLGVVRLLLAWYQGDLPALPEQATRLQLAGDAPDAVQPGLGAELRALALIGLADTEIWTGRLEQAEQHLQQAIALARRIGRPYLEFTGLVYWAEVELSRWFPRAVERSRQAIELARRHGWTDETTAGLAYMTLGSALAWQGRLEEAGDWVQRAERTIRPESAPVSAMGVQYARGQIDLARGRAADALSAFQAAERLAGQLVAPHPLARPMRAWIVHALVRLGDTARAEQVLDALSDRDRDRGEMRIAAAMLRLAEDDPQAATVLLRPVLDGSARTGWRSWLVEAFLLEAIARDTLVEPAAAHRAMERALDLAEPDGALMWFHLHPVRDLLGRQAGPHTAHAALLTEILDLLAGTPDSPSAAPRPPLEPLSASELRVLRYLPTHLTAAEIAGELSVSTSTVKTHMRNLYAKLGAHTRAEAVESGRALRLLAPSAR
jgi:LuxR family maltose regulon positive regulatory protein